MQGNSPQTGGKKEKAVIFPVSCIFCFQLWETLCNEEKIERRQKGFEMYFRNTLILERKNSELQEKAQRNVMKY